MTKPVAQPNLMHQEILGLLVDNKQTTRTELRGKRDKTGKWVESPVDVLVPMMAGHVSDLNCNRAAKRWLP